MMATDEHRARVVGTLILMTLAVTLIGSGVASASTTNVTDAAGVDSNASLEPIADRLPTDPNGDGLYEDIDGDGRWTFVDVNLFFQHSDEPVIRNHTAAYDFDGDGEISLQDTLSLFEERYDGDGDGLSTSEERALGTDPRLADTDGDGVDDGQEVETGTGPRVVNFDNAGVDCGGDCDVSSRSVAVGPSDPITAAGPRRTGPAVDIDPNTTYTGDIEPADADIVVAQDGGGDAETIQGGVDAASSGDVVYVRTGVYREQVTIDEQVTIVGPNATLSGSGLGNYTRGFTINESTTISGLTVEEFAGVMVDRQPNLEVTLRAVTIREAGTTAYASGSSADWTFENVTMSESGGIFAQDSTGDWMFENVSHSGYSSIFASRSTGDWSFDRVTIDDTSGHWIYASDSSGKWTISQAHVETAGAGIGATDTTGDWTLTRVNMTTGYAGGAIYAGGSEGDWTVLETSLTGGNVSYVLSATKSRGDWVVSHSAFLINGSGSGSGISASGSSGQWSISHSKISVHGDSLIVGQTGDWDVRETTFNGGNVGIQSGDHQGTLMISNVTFDQGSESVAMHSGNHSGQVTIRNVGIEDGTGILGGGTGDWELRNIHILNKSPTSSRHLGINIDSNGSNVTISNVVTSNVEMAILCGGDADSWTIHDTIIQNASNGLIIDVEGQTTVEETLIKNATKGIVADGSSHLNVSKVTLTAISDVGISYGSGPGNATLSKLRIADANRAIDLRNMGSTTVSRTIVRNASTGLAVTEGSVLEDAQTNQTVSVRRSRFSNTDRAIWTDTDALDRVTATEFRWVDEAINASETNATIDARENWWGSDGLTESDTTGDVLTGEACDEPCAGYIRDSGATSGDILPTASLVTGEGVAVWNQRFGTTENATIAIEYETTALDDNATATLIAAPNREPMLWTLDPPTNGTVERTLSADRFHADDSVGERVTMILETTDARVTVANVTVGTATAA
ncbi:right-handed parallel beta-helix repeat-containing protein [Halococcoides cellulosivorans]|uniref:Right handed beta helix domain-containing protein n=1 Tax=Halococcoides cellulosivorans TaxID=1679096 RepID=A0A2R4WY00_9EURY|nr:right-handed parallel beta-helix repeat-containing protein [Halococcoides cellulosivorans]AWB26390.1 hypothetical protein HARCEL1_00965 [Halococcoides cellulosivorans]